jgi:hypothetical protein
MKRIARAVLLSAALSAPAFAADAASPQPPPEKTADVVEQKAERPVLEVAFVLDTTGSMGGLLEGAKQKIWSIASRMASGKPTPRIRVGLVAYRDRGDAYVTRSFDLTEDLDAVYKELNSYRAEGGGDGPEHVGKALADATTALSWSKEGKAAKMIFLVGDAPSHDYGDGFTTKVWAKKAIEKGIVVNTIQCGSQADTAQEFQALSKLADGSYAAIGQTGGVHVAATPFDADISKLSGELATHTLVGGTAAAKAEAEGTLAGLKTMSASSTADRISYRAKAAPAPAAAGGGSMGLLGSTTRGGVDLTEAPAALATMKEEELPDTLKALKPAEREAYVKKTAAEKKEAQEKLVTLSKQRDEWLAKNAAKAPKDSFDEKVFDTVKRKASAVGVAY